MLTNKPLSLFIFFSLSVCFYAQSQNLVPNGSFEEGNFCPEFLGDLHLGCAEWVASIQIPDLPVIENPSPDWYHACAPNTDLAPPSLPFGYQSPAEGLGFAGLHVFSRIASTTEYREIIGIELLSSLETGVLYEINMKVNVAKKNQMGLACDKLGIKFSNQLTYETPNEVIDNNPHFFVDSIISDTLDWVNINWTFTADQNYQFMHLGIFHSSENINYINTGIGQEPLIAYYFIDDISVQQVVPTYLSQQFDGEINIFPNPTSDMIEFPEIMTIEKIKIIDGSGKVVMNIVNDDLQRRKFDLSGLSKGMYFIYAESRNQGSYTFKLLKTN